MAMMVDAKKLDTWLLHYYDAMDDVSVREVQKKILDLSVEVPNELPELCAQAIEILPFACKCPNNGDGDCDACVCERELRAAIIPDVARQRP